MKFKLLATSFLMLFSALGAAIEYDVQDIGTLQTHSSEAIAINNQGQILGWYNLDGSREGKKFFVRNKDCSFHELPKTENNGWEISWKFLCDDGKVYGTFDGNTNFSVLYFWEQQNGIVKLGNLPGKNVVAINNSGQVLISYVLENENGKEFCRPVIWHNGKITKLHGLEGNIGIESDVSYGLDMNNDGDVVGKSVVYINYKNNLYKQTHAAKWVNGQAIDLHKKIPKSTTSVATAINDLGDVIVDSYLIKVDGEVLTHYGYGTAKATQSKYFYRNSDIIDRFKNLTDPKSLINSKLNNDYDSIWMHCICIVNVNDNGEAVAIGTTIYGEQHIMLLTPVNLE